MLTITGALAKSAPRAGPGARGWQNLWVRLAVALAFADASIVVLALPQIVDRLHTPIAHVTWVIMAYNLALIVASAAVVAAGRRPAPTPTLSRGRQLPPTPTLVAGLAIFGLASIGCGAAGTLAALIALRCAQGVGGALVLAASLPLFAQAAGPGGAALEGWSAAAAIGAAVGPAAGGILTQLFDWRAIFFAQAPVAAIAALAVLTVGRSVPAAPAHAPAVALDGAPSALDPVTANAALALLSAGIIGALFLVVIELINAWLLSPLAAAAIVTTIPVATAASERLVRGRSPMALAAVGAAAVAGGLIVLAALRQRELGWVVAALALSGAGLGVAFPALTAAALRSGGGLAVRAAKTVAARDAGLVLGLLVLTPVFAAQISRVSSHDGSVVRQVTAQLVSAPLPFQDKLRLGVGLVAAYRSAGQADVPRVDPVFSSVAADAGPSERAALSRLQSSVDAIVQRAVTPAFQRPFAYAAMFAAAVLPLLGVRMASLRRYRDAGRSHARDPR